MNWKKVLMVILLFMVIVFSGCKPKLEVGQVWEWDYSYDPFTKPEVVRREVLAIKDGYIQYERLDAAAKGVVGSMKEGVFRALHPRLISNEPAPTYPFSGVPFEEPTESIKIVVDITEGGICFTSDPNVPNLLIEPPLVTMPPMPPVWGKGELPDDHQEFFGNDNTARLDYVQNRVLEQHGAILKIIAIRILALEAVDPNSMRLEALEFDMEKLTK